MLRPPWKNVCPTLLLLSTLIRHVLSMTDLLDRRLPPLTGLSYDLMIVPFLLSLRPPPL